MAPNDLPVRSRRRKLLTTGDLLRDYRDGVGLAALARKYGYADIEEARDAVRKALDRLDKEIRRKSGAMRAREYLRLEQLDEDLAEDGAPGDPKVSAERRLLSESRRRMYGLDLQPDNVVQAPTFNIMFGTPGQRAALETGEAEVIDGEIIPTAQIEGPTFSQEAGNGDGPPPPGEESGPSRAESGGG